MTLVLKLPDKLRVLFEQNGIFYLSGSFLNKRIFLKLFGWFHLSFGSSEFGGFDLLFALNLIG